MVLWLVFAPMNVKVANWYVVHPVELIRRVLVVQTYPNAGCATFKHDNVLMTEMLTPLFTQHKYDPCEEAASVQILRDTLNQSPSASSYLTS